MNGQDGQKNLNLFTIFHLWFVKRQPKKPLVTPVAYIKLFHMSPGRLRIIPINFQVAALSFLDFDEMGHNVGFKLPQLVIIQHRQQLVENGAAIRRIHLIHDLYLRL